MKPPLELERSHGTRLHQLGRMACYPICDAPDEGLCALPARCALPCDVNNCTRALRTVGDMDVVDAVHAFTRDIGDCLQALVSWQTELPPVRRPPASLRPAQLPSGSIAAGANVYRPPTTRRPRLRGRPIHHKRGLGRSRGGSEGHAVHSELAHLAVQQPQVQRTQVTKHLRTTLDRPTTQPRGTVPVEDRARPGRDVAPISRGRLHEPPTWIVGGAAPRTHILEFRAPTWAALANC